MGLPRKSVVAHPKGLLHLIFTSAPGDVERLLRDGVGRSLAQGNQSHAIWRGRGPRAASRAGNDSAAGTGPRDCQISSCARPLFPSCPAVVGDAHSLGAVGLVMNLGVAIAIVKDCGQ